MFSKGFVQLAQDWQTLIAALLALLAAWWTVRPLKQQIATDRERHSDTLKRKELSARAQMPDALSALCNFTEDCMKFHDGRRRELPTPATEAIAALKTAIEFVEPQPAQKIFELVSFYQVHNARLFSDRREGVEEVQRWYDTVRLRHYIDRLYEYARNESQIVEGEQTAERLISSLRQTVGLEHCFENEDRYVAVRAMIDRLHDEQGRRPQ